MQKFLIFAHAKFLKPFFPLESVGEIKIRIKDTPTICKNRLKSKVWIHGG